MAEWKTSLFGCFGNLATCCTTYFVPCYVQGKIAEKNGEDCCKCGAVMFVPIANLYFRAKTREKVRESAGIEGSFGKDCLTVWCCPLCSIVQEARQVQAEVPGQPEEIARQ